MNHFGDYEVEGPNGSKVTSLIISPLEFCFFGKSYLFLGEMEVPGQTGVNYV